MWKIGNVKINSRVVLAPMAGTTSLAYRKFMKSFGVGLTVTEMVSDHGLIYENKKTVEYLLTDKNERPVAVQLFGSKASEINKAIDIVFKLNPNIDIIDINLGCPVPKVTKTGAGSSLLKDTKYLKEFMSEIVKHSPVPVTAKIRLGWDEKSINVFENVKALEEAGVSAIGIHSRTKSQLYCGKANHELIKDLGKSMKVPLIISGDIYTLDDAINAMKITGATAVMVARGGLGNPWLISQINEYFENVKYTQEVSLNDKKNALLKLADLLIEEKGEYRAMTILRGIAPKYFIGHENAKIIKSQLAQNLTTKQSLLDILNNIY